MFELLHTHVFLNVYALIFAPLIAGIIIYIGIFKKNAIVIRRFAKWFSGFYFLYCTLFPLNYNLNFQFSYDTKAQLFALDIMSSIFCTVFALVVFICLVMAKSAILNKYKLFYSFALFLQSAFMMCICAQNINTLLIALTLEIFCTYVLWANFSHLRLNKYLNTFVVLNFSGIFIFGILSNYLGIINLEELGEILITKNVQIAYFLSVFLICAQNIALLPFHKSLVEMVKNSNTATFFIPSAQMLLGFILLIKLLMIGKIFETFYPIITLLATLNICYFGILAISQVEIKKSFAYFCLSQAGVPIVALCSLSQNGVSGAIFEVISRTFILLALFLCFCLIAKKFKTSKIPLMGGLLTIAPKLAFYTFALSLIAIGVPLTSGFCGKFLCILGGFSTDIYSNELIWTGSVFTTIGLILGALYLIKIYQQVFFGPKILDTGTDILRHQYFGLAILLIVTILLGLFADFVLDFIFKYADMILTGF